MKKFILILFVFVPFIMNGQDSNLCTQAKKTLKILNINYESVKIADGRKNGGTRSLIIGYISANDKDTQIHDLIAVFELSAVLNKNSNADLDEVAAVIGSKNGDLLVMITTKVNYVKRFMSDRDAEKYVKTWTALRYDENYLSALLSLAK